MRTSDHHLFWKLLPERQRTKYLWYLQHFDYSEVVAPYDLHGRCDLFCGHAVYSQRYVVRHYQERFLRSIRPPKQCIPTVTHASIHVKDHGVGSRPRHGTNSVMGRMRRLNTRRSEEWKSRTLGCTCTGRGAGIAKSVQWLCYGLGEPSRGPKSWQVPQIFLFSTTPRPAARLNQPPIQWVSFRWAVEWSGSEADQLPPPSAEVQHIFLSAICFHEVHTGKVTCYLVLAHQRLRFSAVQILIWLSRTRKSIKECPSELCDRN
jgi:hypothetical protein